MPDHPNRLEAAVTATAPSRAATGRLLSPGSQVGAYVIESLLARGGAAQVYRARDERLGRLVALKVLEDTAASSSRQRFLREVQVVAGLAHPNVVALYAAGEEQGVAFAAMELLLGSLADEVERRGRLPWDEALRVARDACLGLDAAWQHGVVHRDVKPSNLLRGADGVVKVADFGIAKDLSMALELTD